MSLEDFKTVRFLESIDQVPDEIASFHGMDVAAFLLHSGKDQRMLWEEAFGDIAAEAFHSIRSDPESITSAADPPFRPASVIPLRLSKGQRDP